MTRHGPALLALSVLAIAGWTYNVNYDTRAALDRISDLRGRIADERERLQVLHVEWAWLNGPDRLARLVIEHNDELALTALTPAAFGYVAAVPYPPNLPAEPSEDMLVAAAPEGMGPHLPSGGTGPAGEGQLIGPVPAAVDAAPQAIASADDAADPDPAEEIDMLIASVAEKAEPAAAPPAEPETIHDAVELALIEAGVLQPGQARIIPAASASGAPLPPARPAVWARQ